ncbi:MAG TPA: Gfo/Idh/MocA family oxidoreductase [Tepidisphaeraceae bacterium]|nr:Gfo/Idh/MocA family oxidoreductase [Tepidisphaeraceae bacterium]
MPSRLSRRRFLHGSAAASTAVLLANPHVKGDQAPAASSSPNEKLNLAFVGVRGKGVDARRKFAATEGCNFVALCDIDESYLGGAIAEHQGARGYIDFRKMLEQKDIDAVVVTTPDHTHAVVALPAMQLGKHVYCEKPLTHNIAECRLLTEAARKYKVKTQMGNQGHASEGSRLQVEWMKAGVVGIIKQVHIWTDRPIWPQGNLIRPKTEDKPNLPDHINWDLWLGPAPERPYAGGYHPFNWRGWWDFGTGALGDMACHIMDTAYWALDLRDPTSVEATSEGNTQESAPAWSIIKYEFPARGERGPINLTWYDGKKKPPAELTGGKETEEANGVLIIGDKGAMIAPYTEPPRLLNPEQHADFNPPEKSIPRSPGHWQEFVDACKGGPRANTNFDYSGPLTETVLLGNLAVRSGKRIEWDAKNLRCTNVSEANQYVSREYRKGWELET